MDERKQILLTNDDGIDSPGLWAAAAALSELGYVTVVAPRQQVSGMGRSIPFTSDGRIEVRRLTIGGQEWSVYAVGGSPAQAVLHAVIEIMPRRPDLVVSGINYGENPGTSVTMSGTVGAALEAAALDIPALAVSLELGSEGDFMSNSDRVDFSVASHFTAFFGRVLLENNLPEDVHVFKVDIPWDATPQTPWRLTRQSLHRYYIPAVAREGGWDSNGVVDGFRDVTPENVGKDSDIYALLYDRVVAVTPLSLDLTSRVDLHAFEQQLRKKH